MTAIHKIFILLLIAVVGCGGGGSSSSVGGSCTAIGTTFVSGATECWEFSTDETEGFAYCAAAGGVYSTSACDDTGKVATCTTLFPPGSLTGSLFTVYWFTGTYPMDFITECSNTITGNLTPP